MFRYMSVKGQLMEAKKKNLTLTISQKQTRADLEFVAIMCDINIPEEEGTDAQSDF